MRERVVQARLVPVVGFGGFRIAPEPTSRCNQVEEDTEPTTRFILAADFVHQHHVGLEWIIDGLDNYLATSLSNLFL